MLDLRSMSDDEFSVLVTPSIPQAAMSIRIDEDGMVLLSSKVAEKYAKVPVQIRFNRDCSAIQISQASEEMNSVTFPKNGRKKLPNAAQILKQNKLSFPVTFQGYICGEAEKWRGARQLNPTQKPSQTTRDAKKK